MGLLIEGHWTDKWYDTEANQGRFKRSESRFRNWITPDGSSGPGKESGFQAEPDRYHLYVSDACPWAHRTLIFRKLKGLEDMIPVSVVNPFMGEAGWTFEPGDSVIPDPVHQVQYLHQLYTQADPTYTGRVTVPVLWDKKRDTIVNNESAEIIRMFNSAFDHIGALPGDYYPKALHNEINILNDEIYDKVNNGVYKAGFATTQAAYEEAVHPLFEMLTSLDKRLEKRRYLLGGSVTEADWRLFTTLIRFDAVYYGHFKCNLKRIADYEHLSGYMRELYQMPGISDTVNISSIKSHYYGSHSTINPTLIVPSGPLLHFDAPHGRSHL